MCAEATDTDIWNSFRAKGDGNGSLSIRSQDSRLHGIIEKFFFKKKIILISPLRSESLRCSFHARVPGEGGGV